MQQLQLGIAHSKDEFKNIKDKSASEREWRLIVTEHGVDLFSSTATHGLAKFTNTILRGINKKISIPGFATVFLLCSIPSLPLPPFPLYLTKLQMHTNHLHLAT
jgi:hypothetical protein